MGQLTITFAGICTHFLRSENGVKNLPVPHRVVLPYVGMFRFGLVDTTIAGVPMQPYFIQPHFAFLKYDDPSIEAPCVPGYMVSGYLYGTGCRITVADGTSRTCSTPSGPPCYDRSFSQLYRVAGYAAYTPSDEVVTGGRAACYFDVTAGTFSVVQYGETQLVKLIVDTPDDPVLLITRDGEPPVPVQLTGATPSMTLYNAEVGPLGHSDVEDTPYDFLLHYETAQRAVPLQLTQPAPGMNAVTIDSGRWTKARIKKALDTLAEVASGADITGGPDIAAMSATFVTSLSPSCSNSQYP